MKSCSLSGLTSQNTWKHLSLWSPTRLCVSVTAVFVLPSRVTFPTCVEGDHVGHQLVKGEVTIQLTGCCAAATLMGKHQIQSHTHTHSWSVCLLRTRLDHTWMDPRRKERRFLQTGSRMSMQLKFRQAAGALAQDRACCRVQEHFSITGHSVKTHVYSIGTDY